MHLRSTLFLVFILLTNHSSKAEVAADSELYQSIMKMDTVIFEQGFNGCDLKVLSKAIHQDFNFYHDLAGIQTKSQFMEAMQNNICPDSGPKPIRKLIDSSTEVYQLKANGVLYGAIQRGDHQFYLKEEGKELFLTGQAKFTHLWVLESGQWLLKESFSFEHVSAPSQ